MTARYKLPAMVLGLLLSAPAGAAESDSTATDCQQLMAMAQRFSAHREQLQLQLTQAFSRAGDDMAHELAPAMRRLGEQLQALARRLEPPPATE